MAPRIDYDSDPNFVLVHDVPILDEHELFVPGNPDKGTKDRTIKLTPEFLQEIAANNNRAAQETGDFIPIIEGHTRDDAPESEQPEILGFADRFHVGPLFQTGRAAILSRWRISKDPAKLAKAKKLPRRSVELWLDRREINPIAMLGATAPERNLGLLCLARAGSYRANNGKLLFKSTRDLIPFKYSPEVLRMNAYCAPGQQGVQMAAGMDGDVSGNGTDNRTAAYTPTGGGLDQANVDPNLVQAVVAALEQTDTWKQMTAFMQQMQSQQQPQPGMPGMGGGMPGAGGAGGEMGGQDPSGLLAALMGGAGGGMGGGQGEQEPEESRKDDEKIPMQAGMPGMGGGVPGGGNAYLPGLEDMGTTSDRTTYPPRSRMSAKNHLKPGETADQCIVRLARERDEAIQLSRQSQVLVELTALVQQEGIPLDVQTELPRLQAMDEPQRAAEYARLRDMHVRYQRMMGGPTRMGRTALPQLQTGQRTDEVANAAIGVNTPDRRMQRTEAAVEGPITKEEADAAVEYAVEERARTGKILDIRDVVRLMRTGQVLLNGRQSVERVY